MRLWSYFLNLMRQRWLEVAYVYFSLLHKRIKSVIIHSSPKFVKKCVHNRLYPSRKPSIYLATAFIAYPFQ